LRGPVLFCLSRRRGSLEPHGREHPKRSSQSKLPGESIRKSRRQLTGLWSKFSRPSELRRKTSVSTQRTCLTVRTRQIVHLLRFLAAQSFFFLTLRGTQIFRRDSNFLAREGLLRQTRPLLPSIDARLPSRFARSVSQCKRNISILRLKNIITRARRARESLNPHSSSSITKNVSLFFFCPLRLTVSAAHHKRPATRTTGKSSCPRRSCTSSNRGRRSRRCRCPVPQRGSSTSRRPS